MRLSINCQMFRYWILAIALLGLGGQLKADAYSDRLERAVSFYSEKHYSEAAALLQSLTESAPDRKDAFLWLGKARFELQDWAAARNAYKKYVDLTPQDVEGPRAVGQTYEKEGNRDLALLWYRKALELEPRNDRLRQSIDRLEAGKSPPPPGTSSTQPESATEKTGFWGQGIAGLAGARKVWWGRVLAVAIFAVWLLQGAYQASRKLRERMPHLPLAMALLQAVLPTVGFYILYWGVPVGFEWGLVGLCAVASVLIYKS
jgi:tetratricopeptide (TPR) repeat protein